MKYALVAMVSLIYFGVLSQENLHEYALKRSLHQDGLNFSFTVLSNDKRGVRVYKRSKFYFWLKSQRVVSTQGASSGILLHGEFEAFYGNKQLARKGRFNKGLKHGTWYYWRTNGVLEKTENWKNGDQLGMQYFYDSNGIVSKSVRLKHAKSIVESGDSTVVLKANGFRRVELRDSLGNTTNINTYKKGQLHGVQRSYDMEGACTKSTFENGVCVDEIEDSEGSEVEEKDGLRAKLKRRIEVWKTKRSDKKRDNDKE